MSTLRRVLITVLLIFCVFAPWEVTKACRGPTAETRVFLNTLPDAPNMEIIAKVEILDTYRTNTKRISEVIVRRSIRGVEKGQQMTIREPMHSCQRPNEISDGWFLGFGPGDRYYIAGNLTDSGYFKGIWSGQPDASNRKPRDDQAAAKVKVLEIKQGYTGERVIRVKVLKPVQRTKYGEILTIKQSEKEWRNNVVSKNDRLCIKGWIHQSNSFEGVTRTLRGRLGQPCWNINQNARKNSKDLSGSNTMKEKASELRDAIDGSTKELNASKSKKRD